MGCNERQEKDLETSADYRDRTDKDQGQTHIGQDIEKSTEGLDKTGGIYYNKNRKSKGMEGEKT